MTVAKSYWRWHRHDHDELYVRRPFTATRGSHQLYRRPFCVKARSDCACIERAQDVKLNKAECAKHFKRLELHRSVACAISPSMHLSASTKFPLRGWRTLISHYHATYSRPSEHSLSHFHFLCFPSASIGCLIASSPAPSSQFAPVLVLAPDSCSVGLQRVADTLKDLPLRCAKIFRWKYAPQVRRTLALHI